ncbi:MAG: hypothetical protein H6R01_466 [Burkholderiaceae bacterium]|nr:hypothetical protein [Burkholderiaceae bacterium]
MDERPATHDGLQQSITTNGVIKPESSTGHQQASLNAHSAQVGLG